MLQSRLGLAGSKTETNEKPSLKNTLAVPPIGGILTRGRAYATLPETMKGTHDMKRKNWLWTEEVSISSKNEAWSRRVKIILKAPKTSRNVENLK
jgi:hypothetical protein